MRSGWRVCGCAWLCLAIAQLQPAQAAQTAAAPASRAHVQRIVGQLRADPDISGLRERMLLHWRSAAADAPDQPPGWQARLLRWLAAATAWLAASSRLLLLIMLALAAAIVAVWVLRIWRQRVRVGAPDALQSTLSVRQRADEAESWPSDIAAAARARWQGGDPRGALRLLYRGLLRALVQRHGLAVAASATEGECLALLPAAPTDVCRFGGTLIDVWQRAAYARALPSDQRFAALCADFDRLLASAGAAGP